MPRQRWTLTARLKLRETNSRSRFLYVIVQQVRSPWHSNYTLKTFWNFQFCLPFVWQEWSSVKVAVSSSKLRKRVEPTFKFIMVYFWSLTTFLFCGLFCTIGFFSHCTRNFFSCVRNTARKKVLHKKEHRMWQCLPSSLHFNSSHLDKRGTMNSTKSSTILLEVLIWGKILLKYK